MSDYWFKPRRYGYGATPTTWQGWAVVAAYVVVLWATVEAFLLPSPDMAPFLIAVLVETALLIIVCRRKTDGTWRWRWGKD